MSNATPTSVPTRGVTLALPPTLDLTNKSASSEYNSKVHNRIEGYAIVASVLGMILLISVVIHFLLRMRRVDSSSSEWKFKHLTLAELEEENMILEFEALNGFRLEFAPPGIHSQNEKQGEEDEEAKVRRVLEEERRVSPRVVSEDQQDQEGVVVGTQVDRL
jgi:hypothetical protein